MTDEQRALAEQFQTWDFGMILDAIAMTAHGSGLGQLLRAEAANRGLNKEARWVGFPEAKKVWKVA